MPEQPIQYLKLSQKAEPGFEITAPSLQRLYIVAGLALFDCLVSQDLIKDIEKRVLSAQGHTAEELMKDWLNQLLGLFSNEAFLVKRLVFDRFDGKSLQATLHGEKYVSTRHGHINRMRAVAEKGFEMGEKPVPTAEYFLKAYFENEK